MKGLVYHGPFEVSVDDVPDARIEQPTDALVRITITNICGSDLHMYEGRTDVEQGKVLGHENMGIVEEVGDAVGRVKVGDRVSLPFNIACGTCANCTKGLTGFCLRANPDGAGAAYGYASMGPYAGGQAEYLRVPWADFNCLTLPEGDEHELDYTMLSDIFPTGWHGVELSKMQPGETIAIWGAGPVGLMSAHSAVIKSAAQAFVVDHQPDRLRLAEEIGATPVDASKGDAVEQLTELTGGGVDRGVDAVGYQAHDPSGEEKPELVLNQIVAAVKPTGGIGVVGVYVPQDPGAENELAKEGKLAFDFGQFFFKGQSMGTGQCNTKNYNAGLRDLITQGRARPSFLVSHELPLAEAADGYSHFDKREDGWTKVVLHPAA
ncbi:MAG: glutathione-independent formaldehyde dehydrogenase [Pseudonocardia sp.]|uniref:glutathione-independent formaldehyde dehydrogenase n=1 Tax=unclassified Pseudonocardia TaxID=2619320 RepID=UPI00086BD2FB|nr:MULTISPECIES: glutathione-independent formaldehyde dehydrogenase [unclassified Pseudonocardia]MBN9107397.1 glutathione-independent formaldehyde dehydrogenase [Pseudonocardia sp.]ODU26641.1 MAG: aldehyde dehydrogenase [Pseudonocardia sp. SCN 72-51]ODV06628.1 MAG: aldehyde dehydrogenase [Pseudonocardia sp. SCN 73-27]